MRTNLLLFVLLLCGLTAAAQHNLNSNEPQVKTRNGTLEGTRVSGISEFKGVPYAQPPVGTLRWKAPQPGKNWEGIRKADHFSPRAMQLPLFSDMNFRSDGMSEDCLYLNIWTPSKNGKESLPVLVYFYGGGLRAGDGSEYRYDGESMARKGIVTVTVNYRLTVFGFLAHPELTKESSHHASGNYGFMDQTEALRWVHDNIAAFGGNPEAVTIAGESAGSFSVSAQIVSPLPRNLFSAAIGESGSVLGKKPLATLSEAEKKGSDFALSLNAGSIQALRSMSADQILQATAKDGEGNFPIDIDGYFFQESPLTSYQTGKIAKVPLLVGWNSQESGWQSILGDLPPSRENFIIAVKKLYPNEYDAILKLYNKDESVTAVATDLASDRFIAYGTWRWADLHAKTNSGVYRYFFTQPRPGLTADMNKPQTGRPRDSSEFAGATHSTEIEYALGNLPTNRVFDWQPVDYRVSEIMQEYFANFIKTKNPNGIGLPFWPLYQSWQKTPVMRIGADTRSMSEDHRDRFLYFEKTSSNK